MKYIVFFTITSSLILVWFSGDIQVNSAPKNSIFLHDVDGDIGVYTIAQESEYPCDVMVKSICQALFTSQPNQELFNKLLKQIYTAPTNTSPDILNLQGRLFWYKVMLDRREKIYSRSWIERWKICAIQSWRDAAQGYKEKSSHLRLYIQDWMPEKQLFANEIPVFICEDNQESMEYLLQNAFAQPVDK